MKNKLALMIAFLLLAAGAAQAQDTNASDTVRRAVHVCNACHGEDGRSTTALVPSLAGQMRQYTIAQLKDFRGQTRVETGTRAYMWGVSALLDDTTIAGLADFYAAQKPAAGKQAPGALAGIGKKLFTDGVPGRGIRPCASCHGDQAEGQAGFPRLAGQRADYVTAQLKVFKSKLRPHGVVMQQEIKQMTPAEMRAVAAYLQGL
jgi:cytochrome c553